MSFLSPCMDLFIVKVKLPLISNINKFCRNVSITSRIELCDALANLLMTIFNNIDETKCNSVEDDDCFEFSENEKNLFQFFFLNFFINAH